LPAKNDNAVLLMDRGDCFAGKSDRRTARSYELRTNPLHLPRTDLVLSVEGSLAIAKPLWSQQSEATFEPRHSAVRRSPA
jgi:hypothetical protein